MVTDILKVFGNFYRIKRKQHDSPEKLRSDQWEGVKKVLRFASTKIPYYIEAYRKAGIRYQDIQTWEDFQKIPLLTKEEKRAHPPEAFLPFNVDKEKIWKTQTTGSSGIPITVHRDPESAAWEKALMHYCFENLGIRIHHRFCQLSAILSEKPNRPGPLQKLGFKRNFVVNLRQTDEEIIRQIQALKPDVLYTFPSIFLRLAEYIRSQGIRLNIRWLIAQGEVLPDPWRAAIQKAFGVPLYHTYGATEIARIGFECRQQHGYHLIADAAVTEILNEENPADFSEEGKIILTSLNNFCSPYIRYQIGDRGILSRHPCPCGVTYPLLENVTGRVDDFIILPSGRKVSARSITHMGFEGIVQYKVIQKSPSQLQVLLIPSETFGNQTIREIQKVLAGAFGDEPMEIEITPRESLPISRTGKLQLVTREF